MIKRKHYNIERFNLKYIIVYEMYDRNFRYSNWNAAM